jgi:hypothetical protein
MNYWNTTWGYPDVPLIRLPMECSGSSVQPHRPQPLIPGKVYQHKETGRIASSIGHRFVNGYEEMFQDLRTGETFFDADPRSWQPAGQMKLEEEVKR